MEEKVKVRVESSKGVNEYEGNAAYVFVFNETNDTVSGVIIGGIDHPIYELGVLDGILDNIRDRVDDKTIPVPLGISVLAGMMTHLDNRKEEIIREWAESIANDPNFNARNFLKEMFADLDIKDTDDTEVGPDATDFSS